LTVVLDSNVVVALVLDAKRAPAVERRFRDWADAGEALHAPSLFRYEVANALTRNIVAGALDEADAESAWQRIVAIDVHLHDLTDGLAVVAIARKLQRESAYDASYIALAQRLDAQLWTLDGPLARNASGADLPVRLIEVT
jgi:predicted nucleic acid-binding protein